jgi:hypothetical protein
MSTLGCGEDVVEVRGISSMEQIAEMMPGPVILATFGPFSELLSPSLPKSLRLVLPVLTQRPILHG